MKQKYSNKETLAIALNLFQGLDSPHQQERIVALEALMHEAQRLLNKEKGQEMSPIHTRTEYVI